MAKGNEYRKLFRIDRFARAFYCQHARLNQLRADKQLARKAARRRRKQMCREGDCGCKNGI